MTFLYLIWLLISNDLINVRWWPEAVVGSMPECVDPTMKSELDAWCGDEPAAKVFEAWWGDNNLPPLPKSISNGF